MLAWMFYAVLVTLLMGLAALAAERAARLRRAPTRWLWLLAMLCSLLIPAVTLSIGAPAPGIASPASGGHSISLPQVTSRVLSPAKWVGPDLNREIASPDLDVWLRGCWILASAILVLLLLLSSASLSRRKRGWAMRTVAGVSVYVAPDIGPAVVGLFRPRIVVPQWITELPVAQQSLVIAHEVAHLKAGDPLALAVALGALVCTPWNAPLWWQLQRLRRAAEVDCDAGVLRGGVDARQYGATLVAVSQRQGASIAIVAAMSESRSFLEERITIMLRKPSKSWALAAATCGCLALALVATATQVAPPPTGSANQSDGLRGKTGDSPAQRVLVTLPAAVLDGYVGDYQYGEAYGVTSVKREGGHLLVEFPGLPASPMYPESATTFFDMDVDAQLSFTADAHGHAAEAVLHQNGASTPMRRVDAATAERLRRATAAKARNQTPNPASEAMLRHVIDGIVAGKPNLQEMNPQLGAAISHDLPRLQVKLGALGPLQSLRLLSVSKEGMDVYQVQHERGTSEWGIALDASGKLVGATVPL